MHNVIRTYVAGEVKYEGQSQEEAIRTWDHETVGMATSPAGGVSIQTFDEPDGIMLRDGWLLHVNESGNVYLNPRV